MGSFWFINRADPFDLFNETALEHLMLGFSLPKILVLAAIVALIWYGFKIFGRGRELEKSIKKGDISGGNEKQNVDLEECPICEAYVDAGASSCGKNGCPLPLG
ncbi:MAG TPA: hypothetical protein EYO02_03255 [Rhodospirillales bacterium]|nr:hypothetical protein [Rhodospirillaceae bacterium]HIA81119.1 hypothetical protein [Rhodospirillales bacterium]HIP10026.1 hypothetical protein [Rhodospirillales bacterium]